MKNNSVLRNSQIIILGVCIVIATVVSSIILSSGFLKVMKLRQEQITVTGSAQKCIKSNYIFWICTFSRVENNLPAVYKKLKEDLSKVKEYLLLKGITENEITVPQISTDIVYKKNERGNNTNDIQGYILSQKIEVRSEDVDKVSRVSRESTELINQGIEFMSKAPEYTYTKLEDLKVEMLAKAGEDAKKRAESMVKATGNKIGFMRSAKMGVFQITPINSTEISDYGINDVSSLDKKVTAVVSASFAIK